MGVMAFPYTAVLDVTANTLLGNNTGSAAAAQALTASQVRTLCSLYSTSEVDTLLAGKASSSHTHGNITNAGAIGSTSGVPIITGTSGVLQAGSFGSTSGTFCVGNDSRLSDARTPTAHKTTHATGGTDALTAADIGAAATSHTHAASDITSGTIATARLASGTADATTYLRGDQTWATVTAGVGGSTGSIDNILLRSDGTGGSTLQGSGWSVPDIYTASPNATVNHLSLQATGSTTNVSVSVVPKGTGAFSLAVPDGTTTGGNVRGARAVDLQTSRTAATQVASGSDSAITGSTSCTAAATTSQVMASSSCSASSGTNAAIIACIDVTLAISQMCASIAVYGGSSSTVNNSVGLAGQYSNLNRSSQITHSSGRWGTNGDLQSFRLTGGGKTTTNAAVELNFGLGTGNAPIYITVASGYVVSGTLLVHGVKSDGSATARYSRQFTIRRVGNATTLDSVVTVGTDYASGTSLSVTADDTNERLKIEPTGVLNETWRWQVIATCIEQAYGT